MSALLAKAYFAPAAAQGCALDAGAGDCRAVRGGRVHRAAAGAVQMPQRPVRRGGGRGGDPGRECFTSVKWVDRLELTAEAGERTGEHIACSRLRSR